MPEVTDAMLEEVALSRAEYEAIVDRLNRPPSDLELGLFGALWSEHCGYKHTKALLRQLPQASNRLLVEQGAENAGVVDIGDGYAVAFKIESHNHPSAVEPYQGAATGIGGIVRDILAMGARPIALLNSLRFGDPNSDRTRHLVNGVVAGISGYGNCIGIPNVGGEVAFDRSYQGNPLVNAMCVGLIENARIVSARAENAGDLLVIVGAKTGRDGIHGASGLASRTFEEQAEMRTAVQVGNPFMEKVLIEACLLAIELECVVGMQDCGAAGITSAAIEMAERSEMGIRIDVSKVPQRESGMNAYEKMLSESQERMLLAVKPDDNDELFELFDDWDLTASVIGTFTESQEVVVTEGNALRSTTPVQTLTDAPEYTFDPPKPKWIDIQQSCDAYGLPMPHRSAGIKPSEALTLMLATPNIASKRSVWRQYDHQVQNNTVAGPGGDAAVLRIQGTSKALAMSTDCNSRLVQLDPYVGSAVAVAEACRNLSCVGATPIALTDGLNFGNPETPDVQYQLQEAIAGIKDAANAMGVPVISGNASLYNESAGTAIQPTPIIGAVGVMEDVTKTVGSGFRYVNDYIIVLGSDRLWDDSDSWSGSEAYELFYGDAQRPNPIGKPAIDLEFEARLQSLCRDLVSEGTINSAHDCSHGGAMVAIAESCVLGDMGAVLAPQEPLTEVAWLWQMFGETQSRIIVSATETNAFEVADRAKDQGIPCRVVGVTARGVFRVHYDESQVKWGDTLPMSHYRDAWYGGLEHALGSEPARR